MLFSHSTLVSSVLDDLKKKKGVEFTEKKKVFVGLAITIPSI